MEKYQKTNFICPICGREVPEGLIEKHHVIPKCKKGKDTIKLCVNCGDMIHKLIPISELKNEYNSIDKLKSHPCIEKWVSWIGKRNDFSVCMARKKRKN